MSEKAISNNEQLTPWQRNPKFSSSKVFIISLGFFATSIAWSIYDTNVSFALKTFISNIFIISIIMTEDNIIGLFLMPFIGNVSDRTKSRWGRRMPYIIIFIPVSAILFILIPLVDAKLVPLLIVITLFNTSMSVYRSPVVSLMPDFVSPNDRSKGNGIINLMGGVGSVAGFLVGGKLIEISPILGFGFVSIIMIASVIIMIFALKEPDTRNWDFKSEDRKKQASLRENVQILMTEKEKSPLYMLLAIFSWFIGYQGIDALWSIYGNTYFGLTVGQATFALSFVGVPFMIFAVPAGLISKKWSRKGTIILGLSIATVDFLVLNFIKGTQNQTILYILFAIFGMAWALVNINSIAMVWQMAPTAKHIGTYTGLYYFFSSLAAVVGPIVVGFFAKYVIGFGNLFLVCTLFLIISILFMILVRRGEVKLTAEEEEAKKKAIQELNPE